MIQLQVDGGKDFRRNFVIFMVSTCLYGKKSEEVNYMILNALVNLREMARLNWVQHTMRSLVSVDQWKSKTS